MAISALGVFGIIAISLIVIGVLIVIILAVTGVFVARKEERLLTGTFSVQYGTNQHWFSEGMGLAVTSTRTNLDCDNFAWTYGTYTNGNISIDNALIWKKDPTKIVIANDPGSNNSASTVVATPTSSTNPDLANWTYKTSEQRWCLTNKSNFCLAKRENSDRIDIRQSTTNPIPFTFIIVEAISGSKCGQTTTS